MWSTDKIKTKSVRFKSVRGFYKPLGLCSGPPSSSLLHLPWTENKLENLIINDTDQVFHRNENILVILLYSLLYLNWCWLFLPLGSFMQHHHFFNELHWCQLFTFLKSEQVYLSNFFPLGECCNVGNPNNNNNNTINTYINCSILPIVLFMVDNLDL